MSRHVVFKKLESVSKYERGGFENQSSLVPLWGEASRLDNQEYVTGGVIY